MGCDVHSLVDRYYISEKPSACIFRAEENGEFLWNVTTYYLITRCHIREDSPTVRTANLTKILVLWRTETPIFKHRNVPSRQTEAADQGVIIFNTHTCTESFFENIKQLLNSTIFAFCASPDTLTDTSELYS